MSAVTRLISLCHHYFVVAMILGAVLCQPAAGVHVVANGTLLTVGGQTTLVCGRTDPTEVIVYWWRNDRQIRNDSAKYLIQTRGTNSTLTVYSTGGPSNGEGDVGLYQCLSSPDGNRRNVNLFARPVVNEPDSQTVTLNEGDSLDLVCTGWGCGMTIYCQLSRPVPDQFPVCTGWGWPVPSIQWTREDRTDRAYSTHDVGVTLRDVMTSYNVTLRSAGLNIHNLNRTDQLNYQCMVANNFGYTNITIFVRVKDRLAAIWPLIGIIIEVIVLVIFIAICEIKRRRKTADDDDAKCK